MAIPNSPDWSSLTDVKAYPQPAFAKPATPEGAAAVSLGPVALNDSQGVLNSRYWLVTQEAETGNVEIAGAVGAEWDSPVPLFSEAADVEQIALTFDQLGRPLVFYRTGADTLKLYWYDPVLQESVNVAIATGIDPLTGFDFPQDTGQSFSDALLFYVRNDTVYMRVQRDRFATEYVCPASEPGLTLISNGLRVDNRYQVVYQYPAADYVPPIVPPPVIPVTGDYYYLNSWGNCLVSNYRLDVVNDPFKLGFKVRDSFARPLPGGGGVSNNIIGQILFGSDNELAFSCRTSLNTLTDTATCRIGRGGSSSYANFDLSSFDGEWLFEFRGLDRRVTITKDGVVVFDGDMSQPNPNNAKPVGIVFAGELTSNGRVNNNLFGIAYDCWIEHAGNRIDWAVKTKGDAVQPSLPAGQEMTILNHKPQNWVRRA